MKEQDLYQAIATSLVERDTPLPHPSEEDWAKVNALCGCELDETFVSFVNLQSQYLFLIETFVGIDMSLTNPNWSEAFQVASIPQMYEWEVAELVARKVLDKPIVPFAAVGNGDLFCIMPDLPVASAVVYLHHGSFQVELVSPSFESWLHAFPAEVRGARELMNL